MAHLAQITLYSCSHKNFLSHSITYQILPNMGPTAYWAHLASFGPFGLFTTQVHGIARGSQATYRSLPYECSHTRKTTIAKLLAFRHFGISTFTDLLVRAVYVHTW